MPKRILAAILLAAVAGCGDEEGPSEAFTVEVTPAAAGLFSAAPGNTVTLTVQAKDGGGQVLGGGTKAFTSGNAAVATVDAAGKVTAVGAGTASITASVTIGGTTESATASITVEVAPAAATVTAPALDFTPPIVDVQAGGSVTWSIADVHHAVEFTSGGAPQDVPELQNSTAARAFPTSGTYTYRCPIHPSMTGSVRVH